MKNTMRSAMTGVMTGAMTDAMRNEDWDESDDSLDVFDTPETTDAAEDSRFSAKRSKAAMADLRRKLEDRLESKRLRESYEFDSDYDDIGYDDSETSHDSVLDRLG